MCGGDATFLSNYLTLTTCFVADNDRDCKRTVRIVFSKLLHTYCVTDDIYGLE